MFVNLMKSDWLLIYGRINGDNCIGIENDVYMYLAVQLMNCGIEMFLIKILINPYPLTRG